MQLIVWDEDIDQELNKKSSENNDFLLHHFIDKQDEMHKKYALYKFNDQEALPQDIKDSILGKRAKQS
jgi:hypothetical protein